MATKKLLLVGYFPDNPFIYAYATSFVPPLKNLGFEVTTFNYRQTVLPFNKCTLCSLYNKYYMNKQFINCVSALKPNVIFFIKAEQITAKTIHFVRKKYTPYLINFYPDSPFAFWNSNSNKDVMYSLQDYDCFLSWSLDLIPALYSAGCKKVNYFPFAFDETLFSKHIILNEEEKKLYNSDVCFIGTWEPERAWWLTELYTKLPHINLAIWGNEWEKNLPIHSPLKKILKGPAIYGISMRKAFTATKIVLNFIRQQNIQAHNMRTFEVPASNAFLLTQWTKDQAEKLFQAGTNIDCFKNIEELIQKVTFYLQHPEIRKKITQKGFETVQMFTLNNQLRTLFSSLNIT